MSTAFFLPLAAWTPRLDGLAALLAPEELARRGRFRRAEDAARYTLARGGLRQRLGWKLGRDPRGLGFGTGPHGKPHLADDAAGLEFNVSHAGDWVLIGIGPGGRALGVDVERTVGARDLLTLAARFFTAREHTVLAALPEDGEERATAFFRLWTRKEACAKACGEGLTATLDTCEALPPDPGPADGAVLAGRWRVWDLSPPAPGYAAALAVEHAAPAPPPEVRLWLPESREG